jgi:hypothetical protein
MKPFKTIAILSIIIASALPLFFSGFFIAGRVIIRQIMMARLEKENVQTIYVPIHEFKWFKENREIVVDDRMFDVKTVERKDSVYEVTGVFDEMETELNLQLEKSSGNRNSSASPNGIYQVCLGIIADRPGNLITEIEPEFVLLHKLRFPGNTRLCWTCLEQLSPPPES